MNESDMMIQISFQSKMSVAQQTFVRLQVLMNRLNVFRQISGRSK
jgi:hypothetical protein